MSGYPPKEYIVAANSSYNVWNNGLIEYSFGRQWDYQRLNDSPEKRLKLIELLKKCIPGEKYQISYLNPPSVILKANAMTFLGFREEECPECKQSHLIWENKIQLCKGCDYIHAFEYDDS